MKSQVDLSPGDIIRVDFSPTAGHEQSGQRPAIVLSHKALNRKTGMPFVAPITNTQRLWEGEIPLPTNLKTTGVIVMTQLRVLDLSYRGYVFVESVPIETLEHARALITAFLLDETS